MKTLALIIGALLTMTTSAFAQFGFSTNSDAVFTPVTPCRLFDTRTSQGGTGSIAANGTKGFAIWGKLVMQLRVVQPPIVVSLLVQKLKLWL